MDVGENAETVGKYVRGQQYTFPVLLDEEHEAEWQYRLSVFPTLVDRQTGASNGLHRGASVLGKSGPVALG